MMPFKDQLTEKRILELAKHVREFEKTLQPEHDLASALLR